MNHNRRMFLKSFALSVGAIAVAPFVKIREVFAAHVEPKSTMATALKYTDDAKAKSPPERKDKKAFCNNCNFYQGDAKSKAAPCTIFSGAEVNANAWCSSWTKKEKKKA